MTAPRGRPKKPMPMHPNRVLAQAIKTGLSTTVFIQGATKNQATAHLYESSKRLWRDAKRDYIRSTKKGKPDFSQITSRENNIRKNALQMLFEKAAAYGNTEVARAKDPDDIMGPLNQRLNIAGAALREFAMTLYPFPDLDVLAGESRCKQRRTDSKGYPASSLGPEVEPIHKTLPELDFIDCVRTQIQHLATHCFIHDVPLSETRKYCNLFLLKIRPYLDYIYSEHTYGKKGHRVGTLRALRELKKDISANYAFRIRDTRTVTSSLDEPEPSFSVDFFSDVINEARSSGILHPALDELERIKNGGYFPLVNEEEPCLTEKDVSYIWSILLKKSRRVGSRIHRHISSMFPGFWDIKHAIRNADEIGSSDEYMLCSEIPVETGSGPGRVDLILLRREPTERGLKILWRPVMILDIKSKSAFLMDVVQKEIESESRVKYGKDNRVVADFQFHNRSLNEEEWSSIIKSTPNQRTKAQIRNYEKAVKAAYQELANNDTDFPIIKATLLIDASENARIARIMIRALVIKAFESLEGKQDTFSRTLFKPIVTDSFPRIAIVVHEQKLPPLEQKIAIAPPWKPPYDPLTGAREEGRKFILYLAAKSPTSAGQSAAWISQYYNGLQFLHNLAGHSQDVKIVWLDLIDDFANTLLAESRLRLRSRSNSDVDLLCIQPSYIMKFFKSIEILGLYKDIKTSVFGEKDVLNLGNRIRKKPGQDMIVVVSGWDIIRGSTPARYQTRLARLLSRLLTILPDDNNTTIVWFDSPVPAEMRSEVYSTRTLFPFWQDSALLGVVNRIIWNLPVPPKSEVEPDEWYLPVIPGAPFYDDIRVIVDQDLKGFSVFLDSVTPLLGWSSRFRTQESSQVLEEPYQTTQQLVPNKDIRNRMKLLALTLIPWIIQLWPEQILSVEDGKQTVQQYVDELHVDLHITKSGLDVQTIHLEDEAKSVSNILQRVLFRPGETHGKKAYAQLVPGMINSQRLYRGPNILKTYLKKSSNMWHPIAPEIVPGSDIRYGVTIPVFLPELNGEWIILEDFYNPARMLVGLFTERNIPDSRGFFWGNLTKETIDCLLTDEIKELPRCKLLFQQKDEDWLCWKWEYDTANWVPLGLAELVTGTGGSLVVLRGIRHEQEPSQPKEPCKGLPFPRLFEERILRCLNKISELVDRAISINIRLNWNETGCLVTFVNQETDVILQKTRISGIADLIELLQWTHRNAMPVKLSSGEYVTWDLFAGIDYGEISLAKMLAETYVPMTEELTIPHFLADIYKLPSMGSISYTIQHDLDLCPIFIKNAENHDRCWSIILSTSKHHINILPQGPLTDREILLHVGPGYLFDGLHKYELRLKLKTERDDEKFLVLRESPMLRKLLRKHDVKVQHLAPGTYLKAESQRWIVDLRVQGHYIIWEAKSNLTGEYFDNRAFNLQLDPRLTLDEEAEALWDFITDNIPAKLLDSPDILKERIRTMLEIYGYGKEPVPCRLAISQEGNRLRLVLLLDRDGIFHPIESKEFDVQMNTSNEAFLDGLLEGLDQGDLSGYNIVNREEFMEDLSRLLNESNEI